MKKLFFFLLLLGTGYLLTIGLATPTLAQDNTFSCEWQPGGIGCVVNNAATNCAPCYGADPSVCSANTTMDSCQGTFDQPCQPASNCNYRCSLSGCQVDASGPYTSWEECQTAASYSCNVYRCSGNSCQDVNYSNCLSDYIIPATACEESCGIFPCIHIGDAQPPTPTPVPALDCGTCTHPGVAGECNDGCYGIDPPGIPTCQCIADPESLTCGQYCTNDTECPPECGNCWGTGIAHLIPPVVCRNDYGNPYPAIVPAVAQSFDPCRHVTGNRDDCYTCTEAGNAWTSLGCLPTSVPRGFGAWLLGRSIAIGGGIAFLLMLYASFLIMTSQSDPQKLQAGKELLTAAIVGLLMLVFSLFIIRFVIGTTLGLPIVG